MKNYYINTLTEDQTEINIIYDYWENSNFVFNYKLKNISNKYGYNTGKIVRIIQDKCVVRKNLKCNECSNDYEITIRTRSKLKVTSGTCQNCMDEREKEIIFQNFILAKKETSRINSILDDAIKKKKWIILNNDELNILRKIIYFKNLNDIKKYVFNKDFYDKNIWAIVNKLHKLGLIYVKREPNSKSVNSFIFHENLDRVLNNEVNYSLNDSFSFTIIKGFNKNNYKGQFTFQKDIILKANKKYVYEGNEQLDGSINITIYSAEYSYDHSKTIDEITEQSYEYIETSFDPL